MKLILLNYRANATDVTLKTQKKRSWFEDKTHPSPQCKQAGIVPTV